MEEAPNPDVGNERPHPDTHHKDLTLPKPPWLCEINGFKWLQPPDRGQAEFLLLQTKPTVAFSSCSGPFPVLLSQTGMSVRALVVTFHLALAHIPSLGA